MRALALDRANHEATAGRKLTFEVEDSRGNKVFKKVTQTEQFGVASAEFGLADEVNLGTYHLRALMESGGDESANKAEIALNVERYVLPKFKVAVDFSGKDSKQARLPAGRPRDGNGARQLLLRQAGGRRRGRGQGVGDGRRGVRSWGGARARPMARERIASICSCRTISPGVPLKPGRGARADRGDGEGLGGPCGDARRTDHGERVAADLITAVPEGGTLIPNLENQVFILTSYRGWHAGGSGR